MPGSRHAQHVQQDHERLASAHPQPFAVAGRCGNGRPQHRQPATGNQQPPLLSKRHPPVQQPPHIGKVSPYQRQKIRRGHRRIGAGQIVNTLLDPIERIRADITGGDPRPQLAGLGCVVDRRIHQPSKHAPRFENPVQVTCRVDRRSLEPRLQLVQMALTPMSKLPQGAKRQTTPLPKLTQSYTEARIDGRGHSAAPSSRGQATSTGRHLVGRYPDASRAGHPLACKLRVFRPRYPCTSPEIGR